MRSQDGAEFCREVKPLAANELDHPCWLLGAGIIQVQSDHRAPQFQKELEITAGLKSLSLQGKCHFQMVWFAVSWFVWTHLARYIV